MQIKSKSIKEFQETVLNVIIENLNISNDIFTTSLIFSDYQPKYGLLIYQKMFDCNSSDEIDNLVELYENQMSEKYSNGLFVDFKYLNFGYPEFLEWIKEFKSDFWFKSNGYILSYEILNDETIHEEYIKITVEKSRLIL